MATGKMQFRYAKSYLSRRDAISLFQPELPFVEHVLAPLEGLSMPGCIRDASPDAWGRRVLLYRNFGSKGVDVDTNLLDEMSYLLESGSNRIGALDFQKSSTIYTPRPLKPSCSLEHLMAATTLVAQGMPLTSELEEALIHGTSLGGARPKVLLEEEEHQYIAKFSASTDLYNVVKLEYVSMRLAAKAGLNVAPVQLRKVLHKDVLLIERFDRVRADVGWYRQSMVSALTVLGLDEMMASYASYEDFAYHLRQKGAAGMQRELFGRMVFNVLVGNVDDHARNHAVFLRGNTFELTPAYDVCPQNRAGGEASQAMQIHGRDRSSKVSTCIAAAASFHLDTEEAIGIVNHFTNTIEREWQPVCDEAHLSDLERNLFYGRQILNAYAFYDAPVGVQIPTHLVTTFSPGL